MQALNIFSLTRVQEPAEFGLYEQLLSHRATHLKENAAEQKSLRVLVDKFKANGLEPCKFNGFYYGFSIPQISKEFDLLKISADKSQVLDIELKSGTKPKDDIKKQLERNKYYLSHITENIFLFTFVAFDDTCYMLDKTGELIECNFSELVEVVVSFKDFLPNHLEKLFDPTQFLVSPINNYTQFYNCHYFLTGHQENIKNQIITGFKNNYFSKIVVKGKAGTGKTLLLYDMARWFSRDNNVCVIHCGLLSEGHTWLNNRLSNIKIISAKGIGANQEVNFSQYKYIFVDEAQRMHSDQFEVLIKIINNFNVCCIFFMDEQQYLSNGDRANLKKNNISLRCDKEFKLTNKIRTNKEMAAFIKNVFNLNDVEKSYSYNNVDILYANNDHELYEQLEAYVSLNYVFINFTSSRFRKLYFDKYCNINDLNAHQVLGQEFDNVVLFLGPEFWYDDNLLCADIHPNPDYLYTKMLFQIMTRVRKQLCIIVLNNPEVFRKLLKIKEVAYS